MGCINRKWSYRLKTYWLPVLALVLWGGIIGFVLWNEGYIGYAVTLIISSVVWWWHCNVVRNEVEKQKLAEILNVPALEMDAREEKYEQNALDALQIAVGELNCQYSHYDWENKVPKEAKEFTSNWNPSAKALIRAVRFHGRNLAIINQRGEIEARV